MADEPKSEPQGLEALVDQMAKLPSALEELGNRLTGLEEREKERSSSPSPSSGGNGGFSLEPLGKAIESMTREFTATIRELAGGRPAPEQPPRRGKQSEPEPEPDKPPPPPSPEPPPVPAESGSRLRDFLGAPSLR